MKQKSFLDLYKPKVYDQNAYTRNELRKIWGCSKERAIERVELALSLGGIEQVWKKAGHSDAMAWRDVKKKR